ncbi:MAG: serine/threonine protein kinase [Stygiobacter sp.]|nr:MAG: serine/threonine protein kinase [Stygiobacter sp.]
MLKSFLLDIAHEFGAQRAYKQVHFVGRGGFKECFHIIDVFGKEYALKIIDNRGSNLIRLEREMMILSSCNTPLISKLYEFGTFVDNSSIAYPFSIEEYLDGGTLEQKINLGISREFIISLASDLTYGLSYIKKLNIVHRDIKPANILFRKNSDTPVLIDFGIARDLNKSSLTPTWHLSGPGTPFFASPEQLNNEKNIIDWRTDQFSLGLVIGFCLFQKHPFEGVGGLDAISAVAERKKCSKDFIDKVSALGFDCIIRMLEPWPHRRYQNPEELISSLKNLG